MSVRTSVAAATLALAVIACTGGVTPSSVPAPTPLAVSEPPASATEPPASATEPLEPLATATPALSAPGAPSATVVLPAGARLDPKAGVLFGVNLDWAADTPLALDARLGRTPAVWVQFVAFPFGGAERSSLSAFFDAVAGEHGIALLTLEPTAGLASVDDPAIRDLVATLRAANDRGIDVLVRFAHEMNGSWYAWGQQPTAYVAAFRRVAAAVHAGTTSSAMLWAPNDGGGYPFAGGPSEAKPGTSEFDVLDTDHDGRLSMADDPYEPYYPGDSFVDWVGMSLYHWGDRWPWGRNVLPEPGKFDAKLTGTYDGTAGDERALPDFYATYAVGHAKPMAIPETAAFFRPAASSGATEMAVKRAWWRQVFSPATLARFPDIKLVDWFEQRKFETEVSDVVDWRMSGTPSIARAFLADLPPGLVFSP
jgi:Glycosyl hydrolase family 26